MGGNSYWQFQLCSYFTLVTSLSTSLPLSPLLQEIPSGFFVLFHVSIWSPSTIYPHLNFLYSLFSPPQSYFSLLIFKFMFIGCLNVCPLWVYFTLVHSISSITLPYIFFLPPLIFNAVNIHPYMLYLHILYYERLLMPYHSLFLSLSPELHTVVPLLWTNSISEFVYDHACICLYVYLLDLSSTYETEYVSFVFLILANFTENEVLQLHPFTFKYHIIISYGWVILHFVYIRQI
jgi:hypothetical protein